MKVFVKKPCGELVEVNPLPGTPLEFFKALITDEIGIAPYLQQLSFNGVQLSKEAAALSEYAIKKDSIIDLTILYMNVFVKMLTGKIFTVQATNNTTIKEIKDIIAEKIDSPPCSI